MDLSFLPDKIQIALKKINLDKVLEIRIRKNYPIILKFCQEYYYLSYDGITKFVEKGILINDADITEILLNLTEKSIFLYNDCIKNGYLVSKGGVRVGLCGECVIDNGQVITVKNIDSLNVRIPHEITGIAKELFDKIGKILPINNVLIISPPLMGKTTALKDIARFLNNLKKLNVLIIDERDEFVNINGEFIDKIRNSSKFYGFNYGLRVMSPDVVITDELVSSSDWEMINSAVNSGVKIFASCHASSIEDVKNKPFFRNVFDYYVILSNFDKTCFVKEIFDRNFIKL